MAVLNDSLVAKLIPILKTYVPVDTGNLRDNGIQSVANIIPGKLWLVQIGYPATPGGPATEDYALYTQVKNISSKGWVNNAVQAWIDQNYDEINNYLETGVDELDNI